MKTKRDRFLEFVLRQPVGLVLLVCMLPFLASAVAVLGYQDYQVISTPGNPASGYQRFFAGSSGVLNCLTSSGANCLPGFTNPMTTAGDTIYGGSSGTPTRLGAGTSGYFLQTQGSGSPPQWAPAGTTLTVASGTSALGTTAISSGACASTVTTSASGVATTDNIMADFNANPTGTTGYAPSTSGMLTVIKWPTSGNVNFAVCNNTGSSITPGAVTLNWRVVR
jgi:hypothetical protein